MDHRILNNTTKTLALLFLTTWSADGLFASAKTPKTPTSAKTKAAKTPRSTAKKTTPRKAVELSDSLEEEETTVQKHDTSVAFHVNDGEGNVAIQGQPDSDACTFEIRGRGTILHNDGGISIISRGTPIAFQEEVLIPGQDGAVSGSDYGATGGNSTPSPKRPKWNGPVQICRLGDKGDMTPRERRISADFNRIFYTLENVDKRTPLQDELSLENQLLSIFTYYTDQEKQQTLPALTREDCKQTKAALDLQLGRSDYKNGAWIGKYLEKVSQKTEKSIWFIEVGTKFPCQDAVAKCVYSNFETGEISEKILNCWSLRNFWSDRKMLDPDYKNTSDEVIIHNSKHKHILFSCQSLLAPIHHELNTSSDLNQQKNIFFEQGTRWVKNSVVGTLATSILLDTCQSGYQYCKDPVSRGLQSTGNFFSRGWNKVKLFFQKKPDPVQ